MTSKLQIVQGEGAASAAQCGSGAEVAEAPSGIHSLKGFLGNVAVVNLGCAKNQVDAEVMLGALHSTGFRIVSDPTEADIAVVNTCGFLQPAVEEGIDTILDLSELKAERLKKLIVVGCMVERYGQDLKNTLPEVDHFLGGNDLLKIIQAAKEGYDSPLLDGARPYFLYDDTLPRFTEEGSVSAFVKISEGCNRPCAFCIIPRIRGEFRSRESSSILAEIENLHRRGVQEVNLVAQDLTAYGMDKKRGGGDEGGEDFCDLLVKLNRESSIPWIRLYYAYPLGVSERLMRTILESERVVNYLDIPLQHVSESVLKLMRRPLGKFSPRPLTEMMRRVAPEVAIRTTFIVGHPGETEQDVEELAKFLREVRFSHVGIFPYSREEGTPAHDLPNQLPEEEKAARRAYLMEVQQEVLEEEGEKHIGKHYQVLLEGAHTDSDLLLKGRTSFQGPDVDGEVIINDVAPEFVDEEGNPHADVILPGRFGTVEITEIAGYDLVGTLVEVSS